VNTCEYGHEVSFFIESGTLFVHLSEYIFLRKDCIVLCCVVLCCVVLCCVVLCCVVLCCVVLCCVVLCCVVLYCVVCFEKIIRSFKVDAGHLTCAH